MRNTMKLPSLRRRFASSSEKLARPIHLKAVASDYDFNLEDARQIFVAMAKDKMKIGMDSVRVYTEGGLNHALIDKLILTPPLRDESLESWGRRISGSNRYGFIVTRAERWNDNLCRKVARFLAPLIGRATLPEYSFEILLFVGNYGYTPFGAHFDDPNWGVIHFQLGPGTKVMTLWKSREYRAINGSTRNNYEPEKIVDRGTSFHIEAGDLFLLPPGYFHVGFTSDFSADIAIDIHRLPPKALLKRALDCAVSSLIPGSIGQNSGKQPGSAGDWLKPVHKQTKRSVGDWASSSLERYRTAMLSLGGFTAEPAESTAPPHGLRGGSVRLTEPFRLCMRRKGKLLCVYVRGREVIWPAHSGIEHLLKRLNTGAVFSVEALIGELSGEMESQAVLSILKLLYRYRGIELAI